MQIDQMKAHTENTLRSTPSHTLEGKARRNLRAARLAGQAEQIHRLDACCPASGAEASSCDEKKIRSGLKNPEDLTLGQDVLRMQ